MISPNVVIGLGNEIARDDGVGIHAVEKLRQRLAEHRDTEVMALPWAGFALIDVLAGRQKAVLIDCLMSDEKPAGTIVRLSEDDFRGSVRLNSFHDIDYPTALALGRRMGLKLPAEIGIWAVVGAVMDEFGEGLTPVVAGAVGQVAEEVLAFLAIPMDRSSPAPDHVQSPMLWTIPRARSSLYFAPARSKTCFEAAPSGSAPRVITMKYTYYPGCSLHATGVAYDKSMRAVFKKLGLELDELDDWNCCGATSYMSVKETVAFAISARNLAPGRKDRTRAGW